MSWCSWEIDAALSISNSLLLNFSWWQGSCHEKQFTANKRKNMVRHFKRHSLKSLLICFIYWTLYSSTMLDAHSARQRMTNMKNFDAEYCLRKHDFEAHWDGKSIYFLISWSAVGQQTDGSVFKSGKSKSGTRETERKPFSKYDSLYFCK